MDICVGSFGIRLAWQARRKAGQMGDRNLKFCQFYSNFDATRWTRSDLLRHLLTEDLTLLTVFKLLPIFHVRYFQFYFQIVKDHVFCQVFKIKIMIPNFLPYLRPVHWDSVSIYLSNTTLHL